MTPGEIGHVVTCPSSSDTRFQALVQLRRAHLALVAIGAISVTRSDGGRIRVRDTYDIREPECSDAEADPT